MMSRHSPAVVDGSPNCDWINLDMNGPSPVAISAVAQRAKVFAMNVKLVSNPLVAGMRSFNCPLIFSSRGGRRPSFIARALEIINTHYFLVAEMKNERIKGGWLVVSSLLQSCRFVTQRSLKRLLLSHINWQNLSRKTKGILYCVTTLGWLSRVVHCYWP